MHEPTCLGGATRIGGLWSCVPPASVDSAAACHSPRWTLGCMPPASVDSGLQEALLVCTNEKYQMNINPPASVGPPALVDSRICMPPASVDSGPGDAATYIYHTHYTHIDMHR